MDEYCRYYDNLRTGYSGNGLWKLTEGLATHKSAEPNQMIFFTHLIGYSPGKGSWEFFQISVRVLCREKRKGCEARTLPTPSAENIYAKKIGGTT